MYDSVVFHCVNINMLVIMNGNETNALRIIIGKLDTDKFGTYGKSAKKGRDRFQTVAALKL